MARQKLASKPLLAAVVSLAVLAALGAWLAFRPPAALRTLVRGARPGAGPGAGAVEAPPGDAPAASDPGPAGTGDPTASPAGGDPPSDPGDVAPEAAHVLRGVVVTPGGAPIAGARVDAARSPEPEAAAAAAPRGEEDDVVVVEPPLARRPASRTGRTDADGRFDIGGLAGGYYDLDITARGFGRRNVARARSREAGSREGALRIVLHTELSLHGEVLDRRGRPIAGAEVTLTFLAADAGDLDVGALDASGGGPVHRARTDADGRFRLGGLGRGVYRAEASGAGYSPATAPLVEVHDPDAAAEGLVFELDDGRGIRGIVRGEGGGPLAGARVRLLAPYAGHAIGAAAVRGAATGADGTFQIEGLPADAYELVVSASAHRDRTLDAVAGGEVVQIVLEPAVPLEGSVVDRTSGHPLPDADVRWRPAAGAWTNEEPALAARTDAGGRFRIERFPEDGRAIRIDAEGYSALEVEVADAPGGGWTLALERSGSVSGRVRAPPGLPVEGLRVSFIEAAPPVAAAGAAAGGRSQESRRSRPVPGRSTTDADGFYRVSVPGIGSYRVVVDGDPYVAATSEVLIVPGERTEIDGVDIFLSLAATVEGAVFSRDLGRVAGALVRVVPEGPLEEAEPASVDAGAPAAAERASLLRGHRDARADATGAFTVGGLRAGAYRAIARAPGFITARSEIFHLADGGTQAIELELEPEMTITGRVLEPAGAPIPLAEIRAVPGGEAGEPWNREMSLSSAAGTFRLSRLAPRSYDLRFSAEGFAPDVLFGVAAGSEDASVRLERLVPLSGRVLGTYTGEPVVQFKLRLRFVEEHRLSARDGESLHGWRSFSDAAGAFRIDDVPPGLYLVEASAPGHLGVEAVEIEVPAGGLEDAEILMEEAGLVMGVVVDAHGNGIAGARVEALQRQVDPDRGTVSFRPISLPRPRSGEGASESPEDGGGARGRRGGRGGRGGRDGDRSPAAAMTGGDGSFAIRGLPDGVYRLSVTHDDHLSRELGDYAFENGLSGHAPVTLSILLPSGVTLLGRVRGVPGAGAGDISILLRPVSLEAGSRGRRGWRSKSARVDDSGRFEIRGLEVGDYVLTARYRGADGSPVSMRRDLRVHGTGREQGVLLDFSR